MARGAAPGQVSTLANRGAARPPGAAPPNAGALRRRTGGGSGKPGGSLLRFYSDDVPGLKISPVAVLVMSLCFIGFVTFLHAGGKLLSFARK